MLNVAIKYKEELINKMYNIWFDEKYKYYNASVYFSNIEINDDTWNKHQFVSIDKDKNIIGYIKYNINRETNNCNSLQIINFTDNIIFGIDLGKAIKDVFEKFNFNKLNFSVVIGNPIEKSYDKMINKYNGRIVGIKKDEVKLYDGKLYDLKLYEINRDNYINKGKIK